MRCAVVRRGAMDTWCGCGTYAWGEEGGVSVDVGCSKESSNLASNAKVSKRAGEGEKGDDGDVDRSRQRKRVGRGAPAAQHHRKDEG